MRKGFTLQGKGLVPKALVVLNECTKGDSKVKDISSTHTITRWLEGGCPGLRLRPEDKIEDER